MLQWSLTFFVIALIAAMLGFNGVAGMSMDIGWIFVVVAVIFLVVGFLSGRRPPPPLILLFAVVVAASIALAMPKVTDNSIYYSAPSENFCSRHGCGPAQGTVSPCRGWECDPKLACDSDYGQWHGDACCEQLKRWHLRRCRKSPKGLKCSKIWPMVRG